MLWCSDPGSNISNYFKVCILLCVVLFWMSILMFFYTFSTAYKITSVESEFARFDTEFSSVIFAFVIYCIVCIRTNMVYDMVCINDKT